MAGLISVSVALGEAPVFASTPWIEASALSDVQGSYTPGKLLEI